MGVVRQAVNRSAGRSGIMGRSSLASQAASWMQFFMDGGRGIWARGWFGLIAATCRETLGTELSAAVRTRRARGTCSADGKTRQLKPRARGVPSKSPQEGRRCRALPWRGPSPHYQAPSDHTRLVPAGPVPRWCSCRGPSFLGDCTTTAHTRFPPGLCWGLSANLKFSL